MFGERPSFVVDDVGDDFVRAFVFAVGNIADVMLIGIDGRFFAAQRQTFDADALESLLVLRAFRG